MGEELTGRQYSSGDSDEGAGITLKNVLHFCKLAAVRVLLYVLCALVAAGAVAGVLNFVSPKRSVTSTQIELRYSGIDQGLAPDNSSFEKDSIRSNAVLNEAVANLGLQDKIVSTGHLRDKIAIIGLLSDSYIALKEAAERGDEDAKKELNNHNFFSTRFDIRFNDYESFGLTKDEAHAILEEMILVYRDSFKKDWMIQQYPQEIYNLHTTPSGEFLDYGNYYELYKNNLDQIQMGLSQVLQKDSFYRSPRSKKTFAALIADGLNLGTLYDDYKSYIWSYGVTKNIEIAIVNLEETKKVTEEKLVRLNSNKVNLNTQLTNYTPNYVYTIDQYTGQPIREEYYPQEYHTLQLRLADIDTEIAAAEELVSKTERRLTVYRQGAASPEHQEYAVENLKMISGKSIEFVKDVNTTMEDYFDYSIGTQFVSVLQPAVTVTIKTLLIPATYVWLGFILAGVLAGVIVTAVKRSALLAKKGSTLPPHYNTPT